MPSRWSSWIVAAMLARVAVAGDFTGPNFPCAQYNEGAIAGSPTASDVELSRLWVHGYLSGLYQAKGMLRFSDEDAELLKKAIEVQCGEYPEASLLTITHAIVAPAKIAMPAEPAPGFTIDGYGCSDHLDARKAEGDRRPALADWWAFAFIQGYQATKDPNLVIELENRAVLAGAVDRNCAKNRDATYVELVTLVAGAVKLE